MQLVGPHIMFLSSSRGFVPPNVQNILMRRAIKKLHTWTHNRVNTQRPDLTKVVLQKKGLHLEIESIFKIQNATFALSQRSALLAAPSPMSAGWVPVLHPDEAELSKPIRHTEAFLEIDRYWFTSPQMSHWRKTSASSCVSRCKNLKFFFLKSLKKWCNDCIDNLVV